MKGRQMKKLAILVAALGSVALGTGVSEAANTSGTFNVNITLTSVCTMSSIANVVFAYTSNQNTIANATGGGYSVTCTNTLPYNVALQAGTGGAYPGLSPSITVTDNALNLQYQLTTTGPTGTGGGTGSGAAQSYVVNGTMAANQAGTCAAASCPQGTNNVHTLWVNY
jgi:spore coat protein U domain-containing protein, fimbrial subunit CupE1/2/3/6